MKPWEFVGSQDFGPRTVKEGEGSGSLASSGRGLGGLMQQKKIRWILMVFMFVVVVVVVLAVAVVVVLDVLYSSIIISISSIISVISTVSIII